jgi:uncharacterized protein with GYD domain
MLLKFANTIKQCKYEVKSARVKSKLTFFSCANAVGYPTTEFYPFGTGDFDFTNLMETDDSGVKFTFGVDLK